MRIYPQLYIPVAPRHMAFVEQQQPISAPRAKDVLFELMYMPTLGDTASAKQCLFYECSLCGHAGCPSFSPDSREIPEDILSRCREHVEMAHSC